MPISDSLAIGWRPSSVSGWGVYGLNLILEILKNNRNPVLYLGPHRLDLTPDQAESLAPVLKRQQDLEDLLAKIGVLEFDFPVLHSLRNDFFPPLRDQVATGSKNIGVIFFEDTAFSEDGLARAREYDLIVTGSSWNREILESNGLDHAVTVFQGIDGDIFRPMAKNDLYPGRFVVYSGGKLEYRKGQDVVIGAFKIFHQRHPDALLIFAWANQWPGIMPTIANSDLVDGAPEVSSDNQILMADWLLKNGLVEDSFIDLGMPANKDIPAYLAAADMAVFPNRCEPGTNLVAMEAMAAGLPSIIAANTGQLDLIDETGETGLPNCYPLRRQTPVTPYAPYQGVEGWREPDVEEVLNYMEDIYARRETAMAIGRAGAEFIAQYTWETQIKALISRIDDLFV